MDIVVSGSIAYDYLMRFPGKFGDYLLPEHLHKISVSFLVHDMTKHWGGVGANIAYTLALLGAKPKLFGTAGRDFSDYRQWLESVNVDTSLVQQLDEVFTASFFAGIDEDNNQFAFFYGGAMDHAQRFHLADVHSAIPDLLMVSPNDPAAMSQLCEEARQRQIRFIYDPSQQVARLDGETLLRDMRGAHAMIVNAYEAEIIANKTGLTIDQLRQQAEILVITQGKDGSHIYHGDQRSEVEVFPSESRTDPTGVGDAYRAGFIFGLLSDWPLTLCAQVGGLCASYALEHVGTQTHTFTRQQFIDRFRSHFDDQGRLDVLLT